MMSSKNKNYVYQMQFERFKIFTAQDLENGNFDVKFEIQEKIVYAHKFMLMPVSETMNSWLSDRWSTKDEPIKIDVYTFNCFYQLLCFVYSGDCELTIENITEMVDMAEFFAVLLLKELCDKFLAKKYPISPQNIERMFEFGQTYSLPFFTKSIKKYAKKKGDYVIHADIFVTLKKSFVQVFADAVTSGGRFKEEFFEAVYKWAKHQIMENASVENDESVDLYEAIKTELYTIIPHPEFYKMKFDFLMNFVVENGFTLSPAHFLKFFMNSRKKFFPNETLFQMTYELAEKQALKKQLIADRNGESFNLEDSIRADLAKVMPMVDFYKMDKEFLKDFVVEKGFILSPSDLHEFFKINVFHKKLQNAFKNVYELAENQALKKQSTAAQIGQIFNVADSIRADLAKVMPMVDFYKMDKEFLKDFVFEKEFFLSATELYQLFKNIRLGSEQKKFIDVYQLAEKQALKKQSISAKNGESFNVSDSIKADLAKVLPYVKFQEMDKQFLMDFVIENGFTLSPAHFLKFFMNCRKKFFPNETAFQMTYNLAEEQALKKKMISDQNGENFKVSESIIAELAQVMPCVKFREMFKQFLIDFGVEKGFILSPSDLHEFFKRNLFHKKLENAFKNTYELAEKQALMKESIAAAKNGESFNVSDSIKTDLAQVMPMVGFYKMDKEFLMDFVVEKEFFLSATDLLMFFKTIRLGSEQKEFIAVYELAEKQAIKKQLIVDQNGESFNLADSIKSELIEVIPHVKFFRMDKQFLMDFIVENGFILSPTDFCHVFQPFTSENEQQKFEYIFKLAEKQAFKKKMIAAKNGESFDVSDSVKADLAQVIPLVDFYEMDEEFLMDFVLENGFFLSPSQLYQHFIIDTFLNKRQKFKYVYELAEKQALKKQSIAAKNGESFNVSDSIKADLAEIIQENKDLEFSF